MNVVHLKNLDLNLLKVLDALAREVSVARAAKRLGITPSAVSHSLRRLRILLSDPVVVRAGRSLRLTPRAQALAPAAMSVCEAARRLLLAAPDTAPTEWQDSVGILGSDYALSTWVYPPIAAARALAPGVRFAAMSLNAAEWERQLIEGVADLAVRSEPPVNAKLRWTPLAQEHYVVVMRPGHVLSRGRLTREKYCRADHALVSVEGSAFEGPVDSHLRAAGLARKVVVSVPTFLAGADLARQSDLLISMPQRLALVYREILVSRPLPVPPPAFGVTLVWHARTESSRPHAWFRALIKRIAATKATG